LGEWIRWGEGAGGGGDFSIDIPPIGPSQKKGRKRKTRKNLSGGGAPWGVVCQRPRFGRRGAGKRYCNRSIKMRRLGRGQWDLRMKVQWSLTTRLGTAKNWWGGLTILPKSWGQLRRATSVPGAKKDEKKRNKKACAGRTWGCIHETDTLL